MQLRIRQDEPGPPSPVPMAKCAQRAESRESLVALRFCCSTNVAPARWCSRTPTPLLFTLCPTRHARSASSSPFQMPAATSAMPAHAQVGSCDVSSKTPREWTVDRVDLHGQQTRPLTAFSDRPCAHGTTQHEIGCPAPLFPARPPIAAATSLPFSRSRCEPRIGLRGVAFGLLLLHLSTACCVVDELAGLRLGSRSG